MAGGVRGKQVTGSGDEEGERGGSHWISISIGGFVCLTNSSEEERDWAGLGWSGELDRRVGDGDDDASAFDGDALTQPCANA
ncbi:hypothetical protein V496_06739 [Pseudogymnoascus sp. VKM F-4515 (FW-2607)]|nr:hypothetical protein V496_06739 [Pseudogymnoascus sp. VKM F-4515 (FW-2607)]